MTDRSKIARRSRRKGKSFECLMARTFRDWFGHNWQTSRNSGRTDIPGDIFCVDRPTRIMVECKHRKSWSIRDIVRQNTSYVANLEEVIQKHHDLADERRGLINYPLLWVWRKDENGLWLLERNLWTESHERSIIFRVGVELVTPHGTWAHIKGLLDHAAETERQIDRVIYGDDEISRRQQNRSLFT